MSIKDLEKIMVSYGVVLRAIPKSVIEIYEKQHIDKHPDGRIEYLDGYNREMLIVERFPKNAGKFIFECVKGTGSTVRFTPKKFYDSIESAVEDLISSK